MQLIAAELRARVVRMVEEIRADHESEWGSDDEDAPAGQLHRDVGAEPLTGGSPSETLIAGPEVTDSPLAHHTLKKVAMPALANFIVLMDTPANLAAGNAQNFPFGGIAVDVGFPTILMFRIFPVLNAGLEMTMNGNVIFSVPSFNVEGGRSLHEVISAGIVLPAGNTLTATNIGAASLNFSAVALLFKT